MGDRQWPDPRGWEALTQAEAERDAYAPYDYAQRLSDLCGAWDSQRRPIAAEILGEIARLHNAVEVAERERDQAREALRRIAAIQPRTLAMIERHGFVFDSIGAEPGNWQHLAFTIYTELCEAETIASTALAEEPQP